MRLFICRDGVFVNMCCYEIFMHCVCDHNLHHCSCDCSCIHVYFAQLVFFWLKDFNSCIFPSSHVRWKLSTFSTMRMNREKRPRRPWTTSSRQTVSRKTATVLFRKNNLSVYTDKLLHMRYGFVEFMKVFYGAPCIILPTFSAIEKSILVIIVTNDCVILFCGWKREIFVRSFWGKLSF